MFPVWNNERRLVKTDTISKRVCHCSSQFRKNIHVVTLQDCPQRLRMQGSTVWALESLQRPKWGWASRSWLLDAVASEFVGDCVILAVDVSKDPLTA